MYKGRKISLSLLPVKAVVPKKNKATAFRTLLPVMSVQLTQEIEGVQTELLIQRYVDRLMVIVTQLGKVGMLVRSRFNCARK